MFSLFNYILIIFVYPVLFFFIYQTNNFFLYKENLISIIIIIISSFYINKIMLIQKYKKLSLIIYIFFYINYGIIPFYQISNNVFYLRSYNLAEYLNASVILLGVLIIFVLFNNKLNLRSVFKKKNYLRFTEVEYNTVNLLIFYFLGFGILIICLIIYQDIFYIFSNKKDRLGNLIKYGNTVAYLLRYFPIIFLVLAHYFIYISKKKNLILEFFLILLIFLIINPISTPRYLTLSILIYLWLLYFPKYILIFTHIFIISALFLFGAIDSRRPSNFLNLFQNNLQIGDYDSFQNFISAINMSKKYGFYEGNIILTNFLNFVPRNIWTNKGYSIGNDISIFEGFDHLNNNLSSSVFSELYLDYGLFFLFISTALLSILVSRLENIFFLNIKNIKFFFTLICTGFLYYIIRGPMLTTSNIIFLLISSYLIINIFFKIKFSK